jgi:ATP-dependent protease ClpP protease subunit
MFNTVTTINYISIAAIIAFCAYIVYVFTKATYRVKFLLKLIKDYEKKNESKLLVITDDYWSKNKLSLINKYFSGHIIDIDDVDGFYNWFSEACDNNVKRLDIIINTDGGSVSSSDIIITNLLNYNGVVNFYIPYYAFSAGTMISLTGNNIYMNTYSLMGPTDPQIFSSESSTMISTEAYLTTIKTLKAENISENMMLQYCDNKKLHSDNLQTLKKILKKKIKDKTQLDVVLKKFGSGNVPHSKPFDVNTLKSLQLPVIIGVPKKIKKIYDYIPNIACF